MAASRTALRGADDRARGRPTATHLRSRSPALSRRQVARVATGARRQLDIWLKHCGRAGPATSGQKESAVSGRHAHLFSGGRNESGPGPWDLRLPRQPVLGVEPRRHAFHRVGTDGAQDLLLPRAAPDRAVASECVTRALIWSRTGCVSVRGCATFTQWSSSDSEIPWAVGRRRSQNRTVQTRRRRRGWRGCGARRRHLIPQRSGDSVTCIASC
jgi:hypothetical protein